ncbi:hypothetical protein ACFQ1R_09715 [Mariniflexile jejuense]|uniref:Uncharacterized protein n=1 Tax=Mariniflexile jejuense TaxID=1173582 RepID=A0ABW3JIV9_9FLAO
MMKVNYLGNLKTTKTKTSLISTLNEIKMKYIAKKTLKTPKTPNL